jgi:hypothetical protein
LNGVCNEFDSKKVELDWRGIVLDYWQQLIYHNHVYCKSSGDKYFHATKSFIMPWRCIVTGFNCTQTDSFNFEIFMKWGIILAVWNYNSTFII